MKTTLTLTLLALTIQVMVNGQTPGNQTRKIRIDIGGAKAENNIQADAPSTSYSQQLEEQIKQSDNLKGEEQKLKEEIIATQQKLITKQIAISRLKSKLTEETYTNNNLTIEDLLKQSNLKPAIVRKSETLTDEAAYAIKMAKEIREEADAQLTLQAQLAEMSNAEEKENIALAKQYEAIDLLKKAVPLFIKNTTEFNTLASQTPNSNPDSQTPDMLSELIHQAAGLRTTYEALRTSAAQKNGNEKAVVLNEALEIEQDYITAQIEICLLRYKKTEKTFYENKQFIELLMTSIGNDAITQKAQQLNADAEYHFRLAKEMREEANAQFTQHARLGEMSNAEEKELIALSKQQLTVTELRKVGKGMSLAAN